MIRRNGEIVVAASALKTPGLMPPTTKLPMICDLYARTPGTRADRGVR